MRTVPWALVVVFAFVTAARAQTINGESSYEDNFHHVLPSPDPKGPEDSGMRVKSGEDRPPSSNSRGYDRRD